MKKYLILLLVVVLVCAGCSITKLSEDGVKFGEEYSISKNNMFVYATSEEAINILENGTGIIYFGFPECPWCQAAVKMFYEVASKKNVEKIYYLNIKEMREKNTEDYQKIVSLTSDYLFEDENNQKRIFVPDFYFVKDGKILYHNNDMSTNSGDVDKYLTDEVRTKIKDDYLKGIVKIYSASCSDC